MAKFWSLETAAWTAIGTIALAGVSALYVIAAFLMARRQGQSVEAARDAAEASKEAAQAMREATALQRATLVVDFDAIYEIPATLAVVGKGHAVRVERVRFLGGNGMASSGDRWMLSPALCNPQPGTGELPGEVGRGDRVAFQWPGPAVDLSARNYARVRVTYSFSGYMRETKDVEVRFQ